MVTMVIARKCFIRLLNKINPQLLHPFLLFSSLLYPPFPSLAFPSNKSKYLVSMGIKVLYVCGQRIVSIFPLFQFMFTSASCFGIIFIFRLLGLEKNNIRSGGGREGSGGVEGERERREGEREGDYDRY